MKCPFCNIEMIQGYLQCPTALWSTKKHKIAMIPSKKEQYALHLKLPMMDPHYVESDCCPKCKRIIIDSTNYESNI